MKDTPQQCIWGFVKETLLEMFCLFVSGLILTPKVDQRFMKSKCSQDQISLTSFFMIGEVVFFQITKHPTHTFWYMFVWCLFFPSCFGSYEGLVLTVASLARMTVINRHWCMWIEPNISSTTRGFWKSVWHIVKVFPAEYSCTGGSGCKVLTRNVTVCQDMEDFGRIDTKSVTEKYIDVLIVFKVGSPKLQEHHVSLVGCCGCLHNSSYQQDVIPF